MQIIDLKALYQIQLQLEYLMGRSPHDFEVIQSSRIFHGAMSSCHERLLIVFCILISESIPSEGKAYIRGKSSEIQECH